VDIEGGILIRDAIDKQANKKNLKEHVEEMIKEKQVFTTRRMLPPGKVDYYFSINDKRVKTRIKKPANSNHNQIKVPKLNYI